MGRSNIPLLDARTVSTRPGGTVAKRLPARSRAFRVLGREVRFRDAVNLAAVGLLVAFVAWTCSGCFSDQPGDRDAGDRRQSAG